MSRLGDAIKRNKVLTACLALLVIVLLIYGLNWPQSNVMMKSQNRTAVSDEALMMGSADSASPGEANYAGSLQLTLPAGQKWADTDKAQGLSLTRKIIQNVSMALEVKNVTKAMDDIARLTKNLNGYVVTSSISKNDTYYQGSITIKVPYNKLTETTDKVAKLGTIRNKTVSSDDVTEEFYDSEARLKVLKKKEERLISFMDKAQKVSDMVTLEDALSQVRSDIEVLEGRLKYLNNATSYSQITIELIQGRTENVIAPKGTWGKSVQGFIGSINALVAFLNWLVVALFTIMPFIVLLVVIVVVFRLAKKNKDKNNAE